MVIKRLKKKKKWQPFPAESSWRFVLFFVIQCALSGFDCQILRSTALFPILDTHRKVLLNSDHLVAPELGLARSDGNVKQLLLLQPISLLASSSPLPPVHYTATEWMIFGVREQNDAVVYHYLNSSTKFMLWKKRNATFSSSTVSLCCVSLTCSLLPQNQPLTP